LKPSADQTLPLRALLAEVACRAIHREPIASEGNRTKAAGRLGKSRRQLFDKIPKYELQP
jgi:two-component system response regulator AtoC